MASPAWRHEEAREEAEPGQLLGRFMQIALLGPLVVRDGSGPYRVSAARQRCLLTALALHAGQAVSGTELAGCVWDRSPPAGWPVTLRSYVKRLRQAGSGLRERIVTRAPGYLLAVDRDDVDVLLFEKLCLAGHEASWARDWQRAFDSFTAAAGLWRGWPFADIPVTFVRARRAHLEEMLLDAVAARIDAGLRLGPDRIDGLISQLRQLASDYPEREHFTAQLMVALHRIGRRTEALAWYQEASRRLHDMGLRPHAELRDIHRQILEAG